MHFPYDRLTYNQIHTKIQNMSKELLPPISMQNQFCYFWLSRVDHDGRREAPAVWDWAPGSRKWYRHGTALDYRNAKTGMTPEDAAKRYILVAEAVMPKNWMDV